MYKNVTWVAHLRMTVYKGIGKHSSSQRPPMNFDRLGEFGSNLALIMLTKLTGCRISTFLYISLSKHVTSRGWAIFGPHGHNLNKLGRVSLEDATNIIKKL